VCAACRAGDELNLRGVIEPGIVGGTGLRGAGDPLLSAALRVLGTIGPGIAGARVAERLDGHIDDFVEHVGAEPGDRRRQRAIR
jgi:hypothetical protein